MIDLRNYFLDNVSEDDYYWRFKPLVEDVHVIYNVFDGPVEAPERDRCNFEVYDDKEAINKFRFLCGPNNASDCKEDKCWFYVVAYYLRCQGYMIREFPHVLDRPPLNLSDFVQDEIRQKAFSDGLNDGNTVTYAVRRKIVHDMTFVKKCAGIAMGEELDRLVRQISTRGAEFDQMPVDEKLETLGNLIEALLKVDGKFASVDCSAVMLGFVDDDDIKNYRKKLQCYRHSSEEAIAQRAGFTEGQKAFLADYGVTICKALHLTKQE